MRLPRASKRDSFQKKILSWYAKHQRDLPWRKTRDPYRILVSEIMLQQTQVSRVIPKYRAFLQQFPSLQKLARAKSADVIRAWSGLGYNRRALNLQRAVQVISTEYLGKFPRDVEALEKLPGIGPYTARAVAAFAFEIPVAMVDTNIERVLTRYFIALEPKIKLKSSEMAVLAASVLPATKAWTWGHAMMDFGATICVARDPLCETCPLQKTCKAFPEIQKLRSTGKALPKKKTTGEPFKQSNRYYRGRIIALLIEKPKNSSNLFTMIRMSFPKADRTLFHTALASLQKEGIVERERALCQLRDIQLK